MDLLIRKELKPGYVELVGEEYPHLELIRFGIITLEPGKSYEGNTGEHEVVLVLLDGNFQISSGDIDPHLIMSRKSVFAERPWGIYLSPNTPYALTTSQAAHIAQVSSVAEEKHPTVLISPDKVKEASAGVHNWRRKIYNIIDPTVKSCHLVVGETFNPPGNWSSWPPHRHDHDNPPIESDLEEVYYFKVNPPGGFGIQRAYNDDRSLDEIYVVEDGDLVVLPEGYHPVVAAPGYELYYLWVLAGKKRVLQPRTDPAYAWVGHTEAIIKDIQR